MSHKACDRGASSTDSSICTFTRPLLGLGNPDWTQMGGLLGLYVTCHAPFLVRHS